MYRIKRFSIQSGKPDKKASLERELKNKIGAGAGIGALVGVIPSIGLGMDYGISRSIITLAGTTAFGAIAGWLSSLGANKKRSKASGLNMTTILDRYDIDTRKDNTKVYPLGGLAYVSIASTKKLLSIDNDPSEFMINASYEDGYGILILNNPSDKILGILNYELENLLKFNRKADYESYKTDNGYIVKITCPSVDSMARLINAIIIKNRTVVNCITNKKLDF